MNKEPRPTRIARWLIDVQNHNAMGTIPLEEHVNMALVVEANREGRTVYPLTVELVTTVKAEMRRLRGDA